MSSSFESLLRLARQRYENQQKAIRETREGLEGAIKADLSALRAALNIRLKRQENTLAATEREIGDLEKLCGQLPFGKPKK